MTTVYRMFDASDRLIYVGITDHFEKRMTQHRKSQPWSNEIARIERDEFETRQLASDVEGFLIAVDLPLYNKALTSERRRRINGAKVIPGLKRSDELVEAKRRYDEMVYRRLEAARAGSAKWRARRASDLLSGDPNRRAKHVKDQCSVSCPSCGALPTYPCQTATGKRTGYHTSRQRYLRSVSGEGRSMRHRFVWRAIDGEATA